MLESDLNQYLDISTTDHSPFYKFKSEVVNAMEILRKSFKSLILDTIDNPKFAESGEKSSASAIESPSVDNKVAAKQAKKKK